MGTFVYLNLIRLLKSFLYEWKRQFDCWWNLAFQGFNVLLTAITNKKRLSTFKKWNQNDSIALCDRIIDHKTHPWPCIHYWLWFVNESFLKRELSCAYTIKCHPFEYIKRCFHRLSPSNLTKTRDLVRFHSLWPVKRVENRCSIQYSTDKIKIT